MEQWGNLMLPVAYVYYEGKTEDGNVFDSNIGAEEPMKIVIGRHEVIPGFEMTVAEMNVGEKREFVVHPDQAYGKRDDRAIQRSRISQIKNGGRLKVGQSFMVKNPAMDNPVQGKVTQIHGDFVEMDFNHPLAGKDLYFTVEVVGKE